MTSAYEVLGVRPGAPDADVRAAYRRHAALHHPDHGGDPAQFAAGLDAYRSLVRTDCPSATEDPDVVVMFHRRRTAGTVIRRALTVATHRITRRTVPPRRLQ